MFKSFSLLVTCYLSMFKCLLTLERESCLCYMFIFYLRLIKSGKVGLVYYFFVSEYFREIGDFSRPRYFL